MTHLDSHLMNFSRGRVVGAVMAGMGLSSLVFVPLGTYLTNPGIFYLEFGSIKVKLHTNWLKFFFLINSDKIADSPQIRL